MVIALRCVLTVRVLRVAGAIARDALGVGAVLVVAGLGVLDVVEEDQQEDADDRDQAEQEVPAGPVDVVQASDGDGDARQQQDEAHQTGDRRGGAAAKEDLVEDPGRRVGDDDEQDPVPELGPSGPAGEGDVLAETGLNRFGEAHGHSRRVRDRRRVRSHDNGTAGRARDAGSCGGKSRHSCGSSLVRGPATVRTRTGIRRRGRGRHDGPGWSRRAVMVLRHLLGWGRGQASGVPVSWPSVYPAGAVTGAGAVVGRVATSGSGPNRLAPATDFLM
ncbi:hypothetical protein SDC9_72494 [bioreactor metagenome]|uniref:Uncharacterized protein n=1 Tax=bioreactor metagenome TaxID=1076179 RepID=A0A644YHN3_9ZZZZ